MVARKVAYNLHTYQPLDKPLLEKGIKFGVFLLENAACPFKMYGHGASQVSTKKRDLAIFWWYRQYFCLIIKQNAGWLVGMYYV